MPGSVAETLYGRRGGGWIDPRRQAATNTPCEACGHPMTVGQKRIHHTCAATCSDCNHPTTNCHCTGQKR